MNTVNPLFSVLIANYNDGKYIECAIDSIQKQSYSNWEVIIVDDGSTDNSKTIYSKYKDDKRFHVYCNDSHKGCGFTKRRCVEMSHGEICGFVDADDAVCPDALELMISKHCSSPYTSLIYSTNYICDNNLNPIRISSSQRSIPHGSSFLEFRNGAISHFATFKKKAYNKTDGINPILLLAEDMDLYFKLEEVGEKLFVPQPLYYRRVNTGNNISLGEMNTTKARIYDLQATAEACSRRNIDFLPLAQKLLEDIINPRVECAKESIINTKQYKIGQFLLNPLVRLKHLLKLF